MPTTRKRILLIAPRIVGVKGGVNRIQPCLGIGYIAAGLESRGHEVFIYDTALGAPDRFDGIADGAAIVLGDSDELIAKKVADLDPEFIGISVLFSGMVEQALEIVRIIKRVKPHVPIIVGGNHVSGSVSDYEYSKTVSAPGLQQGFLTLASSGIDYAMVGECDFAFGDLIQALIEKDDPRKIPGVVVFGKEGFHLPTSRPAVDIRKLPLPARHLMDMEGYFTYGRFHSSKSTSNRVLNVMASRGCPEKCAFCSTPRLWGSKVRWRDPVDVIAEIKTGIEKFGIEEVQFEDDTLTANAENLRQLCDLMEPLGLPWCTPNGIKANYHLARQGEIFRRMKDSGCYQVTLACESGVQRVLDEIVGKKLKVEDIGPAIAHAKAAGLFVHTFWIAGFPGETRAEMEKSVEAAEKCGADSFSFSILTPLPGTPIFRRIEENNLWWPQIADRHEINYRRSRIKVDGFDSPEQFEKWVEGVNERLNRLLAERDPSRARERSDLVFDRTLAKSGTKQT